MADANSSISLSPLDYLAIIPQTMYKIELSFNERRVIPWMQSHWHWSFYYSAIYLILIFLGQRFMKDRKPFDLRTVLCCWSTALSLFSFFAIYRIIPLASDLISFGGLQHAICDTTSYVGSKGGGLWAFLFPLSKLPELVDTMFIVLRKQKMVILHWYHHVTVFIYCWFSYAYPISTGIWFGIVNYFVHALMYTYYAVKASGRSPPKWVAKSITSIQLSQMFAGIFLNYYAIKSLSENKTCQMNNFAVGISIFFYASYAILFGNFFYWTYVYKKPRKEDTKKPETLSNDVTNGYTLHSNGISREVLMNGNLPVRNGLSSHSKHE